MNTHARTFIRSDRVVIGGSVLLIAAAGITRFTNAGAVLAFVCSGLAVALLAALVGRSVEQLGDRFGAGATGVLQSALGNLPELFIALFALKAGLVMVVQAALIGSILANLLLVLGLAFTVGGLRHGTQRIDSQRARATTVLMLLAVAAMVVPSLASYVHTPAAPHEDALAMVVAIILLALFALTLPASLKSKPAGDAAERHEPPRWPLPLALAMLAAPALVILSRVFGFTPLTLVFPPMLIAAVAIAVLVTAFITFDGESDWGEGVSLIALYAIIATAFWWG